MLGCLQSQLSGRQRFFIETDAGNAVAFDLALDPHEDFGVDGLWTGIAAKQPACDRRKKEKPQRRDNQQQREEDHILRPENHAEDVKLASAQIKKNSLTATPLNPGQPVENRLRQCD